MTTHEIAARLVALCKTGEFEKAQQELFSQDAVSIEPHETPAYAKETKGLPALQEKIRKFTESLEEVHSIEASEPLVTENAIAFELDMDVTMKGHGRTDMKEICVYQVKDGKVISEQFFF